MQDQTKQQHTNIDTRIAMLERDMDQVSNLFTRLETTIEKLADVSSSLKQIIAIHEMKLDLREKNDKNIAEEINSVAKRLHDEYQVLEKRTGNLEQFRWYATGAIGFGMFILPFIYKYILNNG